MLVNINYMNTILFLITILPTCLLQEAKEKVIQRRLIQDDLKYGEGVGQGSSQDILLENNLLNPTKFYQEGEANHLPVGEHRFPQTFDPLPGSPTPSSSYGSGDESINHIQDLQIPIQLPLDIINPEIVLGRTLPPADDPTRGRTNFQPDTLLPPNFIRAEIPNSVPRVAGTIGSGSIGYTYLGQGLFAVGSGSLGFAAQVPSQTGKGSITYRNGRNGVANAPQNYDASFSEITPHAYPRPIDLKRELSEQN